MIEWYSSPELRDRCRVGLNKGEAGNKLARAVFFHERGEIRDGSFESQAFRASGLNLVVSAIVLWNTAYLSRAVESLRAEGHELPDDLIRHISSADLGAHQPHRHLRLAARAPAQGTSGRFAQSQKNLARPPDPQNRLFLLCSIMSYSYAQILS